MKKSNNVKQKTKHLVSKFVEMDTDPSILAYPIEEPKLKTKKVNNKVKSKSKNILKKIPFFSGYNTIIDSDKLDKQEVTSKIYIRPTKSLNLDKDEIKALQDSLIICSKHKNILLRKFKLLTSFIKNKFKLAFKRK